MRKADSEKSSPQPSRSNHANIPDELKRLNLWVVWAYVWKDGRWTKMPFQPVHGIEEVSGRRRGGLCTPPNPTTRALGRTMRRWRRFISSTQPLPMESASCSKRGSWEIDLDKCRDKVTGEVSEWAIGPRATG